MGMANECTDNAYISSSAMPSLLEYMISNLKEEELKPHLVAGDTTPYQRCSLVERTIYESILNLHEWEKKCDTQPDRSFIVDALEDWPMVIQLGIFRPEMVQPIPLHRMCVLDTCILGDTPKIFWEAIDKWTDTASENLRNKFYTKDIKQDLRMLYYRLRHAIYQRANLLQKLKRSNLTEYKVELKEEYTDQAEQEDLGDDLAD